MTAEQDLLYRTVVADADVRVAASVAAVTAAYIRGLDMMTSEERRGVFDALRGRFCLHCGDPDPQCPCRKDW